MLATLLIVQALQTAPLNAPTPPPSERLRACVAAVEANANQGYETARAWLAQGRTKESLYCLALAELGRQRYAAAAGWFDTLAAAGSGATDAERFEFNVRAGNAWLLAADARRARLAFSRALEADPKNVDVLIDRARAYAMARDFRLAEEDLNAALDIEADNVLALMLRAEARLQQAAFELAERDAERAAALAPQDVNVQLTLGRAREGRRLGRVPE